jgi:hypothetical protein
MFVDEHSSKSLNLWSNRIFDSSRHSKVHMVKDVFWEFNFDHESFFSILLRLPYKIPFATNLVALFVGTFTTNFKDFCRTNERQCPPCQHHCFKDSRLVGNTLVKYICTYKKLFSTCNCQNGLDLPTSDSTCPATMLRRIAEIKIWLIIPSTLYIATWLSIACNNFLHNNYWMLPLEVGYEGCQHSEYFYLSSYYVPRTAHSIIFRPSCLVSLANLRIN